VIAKSQEAAGDAAETIGEGLGQVMDISKNLAYEMERRSIKSSVKKIKFTDVEYKLDVRAMKTFYTVSYHPAVQYKKFGPFPEDRDDNSWVIILFGFRKPPGEYNNNEIIFQFKKEMMNSIEFKTLCFELNVKYIVLSKNTDINDFRHFASLKEFEVYEIKKDEIVVLPKNLEDK
jgi:hypothetical protein